MKAVIQVLPASIAFRSVLQRETKQALPTLATPEEAPYRCVGPIRKTLGLTTLAVAVFQSCFVC